MGDPRKTRRKYKTPRHPWQAHRIEAERKITQEYGLNNKKEIWKSESFLRKVKKHARRLIPDITEQGKKETEQLLSRLIKLNLIKQGAQIDDVLALELNDILERRLQTIVFRKNLAKSIKQARQFIVHRHIMVNENKMDSPSYLVLKDEENKISFDSKSSLNNPNHPERFKEEKKEIKAEKPEVEEMKKVEVVEVAI